MKRTATKRKPAKPKKRPANPCSWSTRCKTRPSVVVSEDERYCKTHGARIADTLAGTWVKYVRDKRCLYCGTDQDLEWAHIRSRGAHPALHWYVGPTTENPGNSTTLCRGHHFMFTNKPAAWDIFVEEHWPGLWTRLVHLEIREREMGSKMLVDGVILEFRQRLKE